MCSAKEKKLEHSAKLKIDRFPYKMTYLGMHLTFPKVKHSNLSVFA